MRRAILITINSLFHFCTALWIGSIIGVGAMAAPSAFQTLGRSLTGPAGEIIGHALRSVNNAAYVFLVIMLGISLFEMFYRRRASTRRLLLIRTALVVLGLVSVGFLGAGLMPRMELARVSNQTQWFNEMHGFYRQIAYGQVLLGLVLIGLTNAVNIGPRRDGGHPRNV